MSKRLWIFAVTVALSHQFFQYVLGIQISIIDAYLDPLLFFPVVMGGMLWERKWWYKPDFTFSKILCLFYFVVISILVEVGFPLLNNRFVYDPMDFVLYAIGMLFFVLKMNKP